MEFPEKGLPLLLVDAGVLPEVFGKVLEAKEHLQSGRAATAAEAARMAGISRSAFYKYKDSCRAWNGSPGLPAAAPMGRRAAAKNKNARPPERLLGAGRRRKGMVIQ